jgi:hypothetical protein
MDEVRRIRFLIPPMLFMASLLWGIYSDSSTRHHLLLEFENSGKTSPEVLTKLIEIVAAGGIAVIAGGYLLGTVTYFILRGLRWLKACCCGGSRNHEAALSRHSFVRVWKKVHSEKPHWDQELSAVAAFDFGVIKEKYEGVHLWLMRRWTGFNVAANSVTALVASVPFGRCIVSVRFTWLWMIPLVLLILMLFIVAVWSFRDGRKMLRFMANADIDLPEIKR